MDYISPSNHPESSLSGSTVESMIDRAKELGQGYFAITDHGHLCSILKGYMYAQKKEIKLIPGIELFFKDKECSIIRGTQSENIKYFKITIHAKDQEAYQKLVKMSSQDRNKIQIKDSFYQTYNWADLEDLANYNVTVCTSDIEGMVSKHLLVNRADLGLKYYEKLKTIFKKNIYPTIIPHGQDKSWNAMVRATIGGKQVEIPAMDRIETDHYKKSRAIELTRLNNKHRKLEYVYIDKIRYKVSEDKQDIQSAELIKDFRDLPGGDIQTKANKFITALAKKFDDTDRLLIDNYSYYAAKEDKVVQDMKLGDERRIYQHQYMASFEETSEYLENVLEL